MPALLANAAGLPDHAVYKVAPIHLGLLERTDGQARRPRNRQTHQQRREHDEMKWMRNVGVIAAVVLVVACTSMPKALPVDTDASRSGAVGVSEITDAMLAVPRMELSKDETFFLPRGDDANALPTYPASLLARRLPPQTVCLRISVDELGGVLSTAPIEQAPDCPAASTFDPQFLAAAAQAASDWHFDPGVRCEYPNEAARMSGDCTGGRETPQAVSLSYRFVFEQNDGRGSVRSSTHAAPTR